MTTSLTGDFASMIISSGADNNNNNSKLLANASMTGSLDASLLSSTGSGDVSLEISSGIGTGASNSTAINTSNTLHNRPQSMTLTKEQLEERSAMLLEQGRMEREKRKSVCFVYFLRFK